MLVYLVYTTLVPNLLDDKQVPHLSSLSPGGPISSSQ